MNPYNSDTRTVTKLDENTLLIRYADNVLVQLDEVKNNYRLSDLFSKKQAVKKIVVLGVNTDFSPEARVYIHEEDQHHNNKIIAQAVVVKTVNQHLMVEHFLKNAKRGFPVQAFDTEEEAVHWIKQQPVSA